MLGRPRLHPGEIADAMTTSDEPWKWASGGIGIGGTIGGFLLCMLNPIAGLAVIGASLIGSVVCGIVATYKHKKELNHYIMEDRKRMADHVNAYDKSVGVNDIKTIAETKKIEAETKAIENSAKQLNNSEASYSKETINSAKSTEVGKS